ncbi:hypothetical protein PROP_02149 [Propionicimonas sp. T2.31MG-18]|uniref:thioester domain-containing protein n=1 Tax=Propionicimonas sp. T2.31MG-18 TaxID=3157620 RepID=UPI0035EEDEF7
MATLIEASLPLADRPQRLLAGPVTVLRGRAPLRLPAVPATALSRVRGGTFSSTVDVIRLADGTVAHTDLIRLNPNIDAYSLDFTGTSPRQLSHYREVSFRNAPVRAAQLWQEEITRILTHGYPHVSTTELTRRLVEAGYPVGAGAIREHEAIAATQAAIWRLTNGLELDTTALDEPVRAWARIGDHPSARPVAPTGAGVLDWHTTVPAGEAVHLELELAEEPELESFGFVVGARTGRQEMQVTLERSLDGRTWQPVSHSSLPLPASRGRRVQRRLGVGATVSRATAASGRRGYRFYRLVATGPSDRDGLLDLRDVRLDVAGGSRFRNNERVVFLYDLLLSQATGEAPAVRREPVRTAAGEVLGPFVLAEAPATVDAGGARVVDTDGNHLWGPIEPGTRFFVQRDGGPSTTRLELRVHHSHLHARVLIGARTPGGPSAFTPLVSLANLAGTEAGPRTVVLAHDS